MNEYYYEEIDWLPEIPDQLILPLNEILQLENLFPVPEMIDTYASFKVQDNLSDFVNKYFDYEVNVKYQVIRKELPVHTDFGVGDVKFNYIVDTGGDVTTRWWDEDHWNILHETICKERTWHKLRIDVPHDITPPSTPRITIVARRK